MKTATVTMISLTCTDDAEKRIGPGPSYSSRRYSRFSMPIWTSQ